MDKKEIKEMVYSYTMKRELLDKGTCCGYEYYILNLGIYPVAYIEIPFNHKYYLKDCSDLENIEVHGGLTYSESYLEIEDGTKIKNSWFIGWDYAHYEDFNGALAEYSNYFELEKKKWATEEIQKEVYKVCKQLELME